MIYNSLGWPRRELIEVWGQKIQVEVPALGWKILNRNDVANKKYDQSSQLEPNQIKNSIILLSS